MISCKQRRASVSSEITAVILCLGLILLCGARLVYKGFCYSRDLDSYIDRAQVAANDDDMLDYLKTLRTNMKEHRADYGHTALIFRTPANDLGLMAKAIDRTVERLNSIKDMPKNETAYQVALDDIRGVLREINNPSTGLLWVNHWLSWIVGVSSFLVISIIVKQSDY